LYRPTQYYLLREKLTNLRTYKLTIAKTGAICPGPRMIEAASPCYAYAILTIYRQYTLY
jgi:hypothetical protein